MSADLQDLFDQAGRYPPDAAFDPDAVLRRARRSRNRRVTGVVVATVVVALALALGVAGQRQLSADPAPADPHPTIVPAVGTLGRLAFGLDGDIYVADGDGGNRIRIADGTPGVKGDCPGYWGEGPIWSPDGRYLAYRGDITTAGDTPPADCSWNRSVTISDASGRPVASFPGDGWAIAWSPDSTRVAVWHDFYGDAKLEIYGLDGVRQAVLSMPTGWQASGDFDPVWSPDGASLLVDPNVEIPVDGSPPSQPPDGPLAAWRATHSPDGSDIAYISTDGLTVAAADGSHDRVLVPGSLEDFSPVPSALVWSPTGDRIAFESHEDGAARLAVLDVASGSWAPLADMGPAGGFNTIKFSPEGDQILFTRTDAVGTPSLWSVHTDGSDPRRLVAGSGWGDWQTLSQTR
jgi:Tol biopolymer transport system component